MLVECILEGVGIPVLIVNSHIIREFDQLKLKRECWNKSTVTGKLIVVALNKTGNNSSLCTVNPSSSYLIPLHISLQVMGLFK